jgi:transposase-like protein
MSKIPQGEWSAIAARYQQGESISRIAQSYGCTPPAIHYILKRNKQRSVRDIDQSSTAKPQELRSALAEAVQAPGTEEKRGLLQQAGPVYANGRSPPGETRPSLIEVPEVRPRDNRGIAPVRPMSNDRIQPTIPRQPPPATTQDTGRASALAAGLDNELHVRAEAAIAAFRSSFNAALAEGSPDVRQQLRKAASDLMRVAARTTIVLDRLNAAAERTSERARDQYHSRNARW